MYNDVIIADLTIFFNANFNAIQNMIATDKIIKIGKIMPSKRMRNKMAGYLAKFSRQKQAEAKKLKLE